MTAVGTFGADAAAGRCERDRTTLEAMIAFERALVEEERDVRRRTGLGATEVAALRLLLDASTAGLGVTPSDVGRTLGASSAATTAVIARLERGGYLERSPHPTDGRSVVLALTLETDSPVRAALERGAAVRLGVVAALTDDQCDAARDLLDRLRTALAVRD